MYTINDLRNHLRLLQAKQNTYVSIQGVVTNRYEYQSLMNKITDLKRAIDFLEPIYNEGIEDA